MRSTAGQPDYGPQTSSGVEESSGKVSLIRCLEKAEELRENSCFHAGKFGAEQVSHQSCYLVWMDKMKNIRHPFVNVT